MTKLVLIDGNAIMHRAFHALPSTITSESGDPINAVYGFTSMILKIIEDLKPTHVAVCFDRKEPTFRKKEFKEYQAHRPEMDVGLSSQFPKAKEVVESMRIPVYEKAGFEADDVIGTVAKRTRVKEVNIVTGDKDILQLVDDKIKVYLPVKGLSNAELLDEEGVEEKMGVRADQIIDYKGLVGDPSDNYKGVPGIGPKTAEKLLKEHDSFKLIYKNIKKIDKRIANKLKTHKKSAEMSYKLAKIITNVKIEYDIDDMNDWTVYDTNVEEVFDKFRFRTIKKRAQILSEKLSKESQGILF